MYSYLCICLIEIVTFGNIIAVAEQFKILFVQLFDFLNQILGNLAEEVGHFLGLVPGVRCRVLLQPDFQLLGEKEKSRIFINSHALKNAKRKTKKSYLYFCYEIVFLCVVGILRSVTGPKFPCPPINHMICSVTKKLAFY